VAEHAPTTNAAYYTGWLQTSPTSDRVSLAVIVGTREWLGNEGFSWWGWRLPFLLSLVMVRSRSISGFSFRRPDLAAHQGEGSTSTIRGARRSPE